MIRSPRTAIPEEALKAGRELVAFPGVLGVFFGCGRRKSEWTRDRALCVHVRWKRSLRDIPKDERLPKRIGSYAVDVIEVGHPSTDALDHTDSVLTDPLSRRSTVTALGSGPAGTFGLLSGHGTLPFRQGRLVKSFDATGTAVFTEVHDNVGITHRGQLLRGRVGSGLPYDFAVARFDGATLVDTFHLAAGRRAPFPLRAAALASGDPLFQFSSLRSQRVRGLFRQVSATPVELRLPDGTDTQYSNVIVVANEGGLLFSRRGDSGSLVVDDDNRIVGAVLGSSVNAGLAYVVDIELIESLLPPGVFDLLFSRGT